MMLNLEFIPIWLGPMASRRWGPEINFSKQSRKAASNVMDSYAGCVMCSVQGT
jgi:hypothetical protein